MTPAAITHNEDKVSTKRRFPIITQAIHIKENKKPTIAIGIGIAKRINKSIDISLINIFILYLKSIPGI